MVLNCRLVEKKSTSEYEGKKHRGQTKIEKIKAVVNTQLLSHGPQAVKKEWALEVSLEHHDSENTGGEGFMLRKNREKV